MATTTESSCLNTAGLELICTSLDTEHKTFEGRQIYPGSEAEENQEEPRTFNGELEKSQHIPPQETLPAKVHTKVRKILNSPNSLGSVSNGKVMRDPTHADKVGVTSSSELRGPLGRVIRLQQELGQLKEELETNEELQRSQNELASSNAELKRSREELQKLNSDLQQTRKELEKTQQTLNETLKWRGSELHSSLVVLVGKKAADKTFVDERSLRTPRKFRNDLFDHITAIGKAPCGLCASKDGDLGILEEQIGKMQADLLRLQGRTCLEPDAAAKIEYQIEDIVSRLWQWSERYARIPSAQSLAETRPRELGGILAANGCFPSTEPLEAWTKVFASPLATNRKASTYFLAAALSCKVLREIFCDPFFAFVGDDKSENHWSEYEGRALHKIMGSLRNVNEPEAHAWRSKLLCLLDPPGQSDDSTVLKAQKVAKASRSLAAESLALECISKLSLLMNPALDGRSELQDILQSAAELAWKLWSSKVHINVLHNGALRKNAPSDQSVRYSATAESMKPHSLHNKEVDADPKALDGREVIMLSVPGIEASWYSEGEDQRRTRIWKRPVVLLGPSLKSGISTFVQRNKILQDLRELVTPSSRETKFSLMP